MPNPVYWHEQGFTRRRSSHTVHGWNVYGLQTVLIAHAPLIARAIDISSRTRSGYYDCLYVALAEREGCPLITADQKSVNSLAPHFPFIVPLDTLP